MTTQLRTYSNSKTYHIIFKGIDNQNIFYEDKDRELFLKQLLITKKKFKYKVCAYCLMSNHVHLVIIIEDNFLTKAMHNLIIRYAHYFNNNIEEFVNYTQKFKQSDIEEFSEYEMIAKLTDNQLAEIIRKKFKINSISEVSVFFKEKDIIELEECIKKISNIKGTNKTQVARVIRVGRKRVEKMWKNYKK